jgi:hypothetical protein
LDYLYSIISFPKREIEILNEKEEQQNDKQAKLIIMISIKECKKILNANGKSYTDEETIRIRTLLYQLGEIAYLQYQNKQLLGVNILVNSVI